MPSDAIQLTENTWADGALATSSSAQWFKFTATAATQYIHFEPGTLHYLNVQLYDSSGATVGSETYLYYTSYTSRTLTIGQEYYIKITPGNNGGTYRIAFSTGTDSTGIVAALPETFIELTENLWEDGVLATSSSEWFKFTATSATQYIHFEFGTLTDGLYVQLYDNSGAKVGSQTALLRISSIRNYILRSLTVGQEYYIKVTPYGSSSSGTYRIGFTTSSTVPAFYPLPDTYTALAENTWEDGALATSSSVQWFKFTATAATQYIHFEFGTLTYLYVQLFDSDGAMVGNEPYLYSSNAYISRTLISGQEYYIRVRPYGSSNSGTYRIVFNNLEASSNSPMLTEDTWADGDLPTNSSAQWFWFTATSATQYIHVQFGTLTNLYVQLYDSSGAAVGSQTNLYGSTTYTSRSLTVGQEYYIRVTPSSYSSSYSGTYKILFRDFFVFSDSTITQLTENTWADGNLPTSSIEQWFKFTATAATQYIHVQFGTLTVLYVQLCDSSGAAVGSQTNLYGNTRNTSRSLTIGQEYYIKVTPYSSIYSGTYKIGFNTSTLEPGGS
jgi:hypothetical protein